MLEFLQTVDIARLVEVVGVLVVALGFPAGAVLVSASKTIQELKHTLDKTPVENCEIQKIAHELGLRRAEKAVTELIYNQDQNK